MKLSINLSKSKTLIGWIVLHIYFLQVIVCKIIYGSRVKTVDGINEILVEVIRSVNLWMVQKVNA